VRRVTAIALAAAAFATAVPAAAQAVPQLATGATRLVVVLLGRRRVPPGRVAVYAACDRRVHRAQRIRLPLWTRS
jgi:hypothetical protein